jgi:hypothetical protein
MIANHLPNSLCSTVSTDSLYDDEAEQQSSNLLFPPDQAPVDVPLNNVLTQTTKSIHSRL